MEGEKYNCPHCGIEVDTSLINFKTRSAHCEFCNQNIVFPKRYSTASQSAVNALIQAREFFLNGEMKNAVNQANVAAGMVPDHAAALFIIAYFSAFSDTVKNRSLFEHLFTVTLDEAEFEIEEENMFKEFVLKTSKHCLVYEQYFLQKFLDYDDPKELAAFMEQYAPYAISQRIDGTWLTSNLVDIYVRISQKAFIPKTWFALYLSLSNNPGSPISDNSFYLKTKARNFYNNYVLPIGTILEQIPDNNMKCKMMTAYQNLKTKYENQLKNK